MDSEGVRAEGVREASAELVKPQWAARGIREQIVLSPPLTLVFSAWPKVLQVLGGMKWMVCWASLHSPRICWKSVSVQMGQAAPLSHKMLKLHPSQVPSAHFGGSDISPDYQQQQQQQQQQRQQRNSKS